MGALAKIFTWWNGATIGTSLWTRMRGDEAGRDEAGGIYFRDKKNPRRRWVIYAGDNDGSRVPRDMSSRSSWATRRKPGARRR